MKEMYHKYPSLMEQVVRRQNIDYAVQAVKRNKGAAGIDNMTVNEIEAHIDKYFVPLREKLLNGTYNHNRSSELRYLNPMGRCANLVFPL